MSRVLAYVFWDRPRPGVDAGEYEASLRDLHARLDVGAATFRVAELPFAPGGGGYEDWYLVADWAELGELNIAAISGKRREPHDAAAEMMASGWGGLYALVRGEAEPPASARWIDKPPGAASEEFLAALDARAVWRRQLVLGPAAELRLAGPDKQAGRERI